MAQKFILTAQLKLAAPNNVAAIVNSINAGLRGVNVNVKINVNGVNQQLNTINKTLNNTSKAAKTAANDMERFGEQVALAIRRYGAFTLATTAFIRLTNAIGSGIDDAIKFDREMVRLAQVTGNTVGGVKDLGDEVTRLAKTYGVASTEILEASVTLAQAGISAKNVKTILESIAKTGVSATFGNMKNTTEAVIAAMQQFNLKATDVEDTLSSINSVSARFAVEASDITTAIVRTGGAFQAAGGNIKEFQALFTSVRQTTRESAETIATGFRTIFTRLQRTRTQNFLQSIGIDLKDVQGQFVGPYEAVRRLSEALKDLRSTDPRFAQIIEELGGFRQISKVIPLITKFDVAQQALNVAMRSGSSLTKDAETAQQSLAVQITKVREEFLALVRGVSNNAAFRGFIDLTLRLSSGLIKLADTLQPIIPLLAAVGAVKVGAGFGSFATGFGRKFSQGGAVQKFASGGLVPGHGTGDTVPAALTPGEFVIRKDAVQAIGASNLHKVNKYATGGAASLFDNSPIGQFTKTGTGPETRYLYNGQPFDKNVVIPYKGLGAVVTNNSLQSKALQDLIDNGPNSKYFSGAVKRITGVNTSNIKKAIIDDQVAEDNLNKKSGNGPKTFFGKYHAHEVDAIVNNIPDIITADPSYFGHSKTISFGTKLGTISNATSSSSKASDEVKNMIAAKLGVPESNKNNIKLFGKTDVHGFLPDIGPKFVGNIRSGLAKLIDDTVESLGIKDVVPDRTRNLDTLISESAEQSMKGVLFEGLIRSVNKDFTSRNTGSDAILDFTNPNANFGQVISGNVKIPADAKVSANDSDIYSAVLRGLKARVSSVDAVKSLSDVKKFATGGAATGTDTVPAMLTPGEFVINKSSASRLGSATLNKLNNIDKYANGGFVKGYASGGIVSGIASNPLAIGLIASSVQGFVTQLSGGNKEIEKLTTVLTGVVFQFGIFKTLIEGAKGSFSSLHNAPLNDTRSKEELTSSILQGLTARRSASLSRKGFNQTDIDSQLALEANARSKAAGNLANRKFGSLGNRLARGTLVGGALLAGAGSIAGDYFSSAGNAKIAAGKDGTLQAGLGGGLAGAGQGAAIGAVFGPIGIAVGAVAGGIIGYTTSLNAARKELDKVKFAQKVEEFGKLIDLVSSGKRSIGESKGAIISGVSDQFHRFASASPDEAKNIKANFGNDAPKIDQIIQTIAKDVDSFEALQKTTKNLLIDFSILTDLPFDVLKDQINKQIDAQKKAAAFAKASNKQHQAEVRAALSLTAMVEAVNKVSSSFDNFDTSLNSAAAFLDGHGAAGTSKDISALLEKAGKGQLGDPSELIRGAKGITGTFGAAGAEQVAVLGETSKLLAQLPELLLQAKDKTGLGPDGGKFEEVLTKLLGQRGFSDAAVNKVRGGVRGVIGPADSDDKIIDDIKNNLEHTSQEVGKSLQETINAFKEFAPSFKQQTDRITRSLEIYERSLEKISDIEQGQISRSQNLKNFIASAYNITRGHGEIRNDQLERVSALSGGITDLKGLEAQLKAAQVNSAKFGAIADNSTDPEEVRTNRTLQTQANNQIKNTTKALNELSNVTENLSEIQKELSHEEEARKFKNDVLKTAVFGSREARIQQSRTIGATAHAIRYGIDSVSQKDREGVARFLEGLGKNGKFLGKTGEEHLRNIENNSAFGQQYRALFGKDSLREVQEEGQSKAAQKLLVAAGLLTDGANKASDVLKRNSEDIGKSISTALQEQNKSFLENLKNIFIDRQISDKESEKTGVKSDFTDVKNQRNTAVELKRTFGITKDNIASFKGAKDLAEARINLRKRQDLLDASGADGRTLGHSSNFKGDEAESIQASAARFAQKNHFAIDTTKLNERIAGISTRTVDEYRDDELVYRDKTPEELKAEKLKIAREELQSGFNKARAQSANALNANAHELGQTNSGKTLLTQQNALSTDKADLALKKLTKDLDALGNESIESLTSKLSVLRNKIQEINDAQDALAATKVNATVPPKVGFATGGGVPGVGNTDTVPAMLTPGEFVMRKSAVASIGLDNLHAMNNGYNRGGLVKFFAEGGEVDSGVTPAMKRHAQFLIQKKKTDEWMEEIKDLPKIGYKEMVERAHEKFGAFAEKPDQKRLAKEIALAQSVRKSDAEAKLADQKFAGKAEARNALSARNKSGFARDVAQGDRLAEIHKKQMEELEAKNAKLRSSDPLFRRTQQNEATPSFNMNRENILTDASNRRAEAQKAELDAAGARMQASIEKQHNALPAAEKARKEAVFAKIKADTEAAREARLKKAGQSTEFVGPVKPSGLRTVVSVPENHPDYEAQKAAELKARARAAQAQLAERTGRKDLTPEALDRAKLEKEARGKPVFLPAPPKPQDVLDDEKRSLASRRSKFLQEKYGDDGITRSNDGQPLSKFDLQNNADVAAAKRKAQREARTTRLETAQQARKDRMASIKKAKEDRVDAIKKHKEELRSKSRKHFNNGGEVQYYSNGGSVGGSRGSGRGMGIKGVQELGKVVQKFSTIINDFTKNLTQFKDMSITLKATHKVDVTFNGAEAFKSMGAEFEKMAVAETKKAINNMLETKFPNVGKMD